MDISAPCLREIHSLYPGVSERFAHQILTSTLNQAAVLKINSNLERTGDIAESIAKFVINVDRNFDLKLLLH